MTILGIFCIAGFDPSILNHYQAPAEHNKSQERRRWRQRLSKQVERNHDEETRFPQFAQYSGFEDCVGGDDSPRMLSKHSYLNAGDDPMEWTSSTRENGSHGECNLR